MDERALEEAEDWKEYWRHRAEEAEGEVARLEDVTDDLKTRLIVRQDQLLRLVLGGE